MSFQRSLSLESGCTMDLHCYFVYSFVDVVTDLARVGMLSELLYSGDLVLGVKKLRDLPMSSDNVGRFLRAREWRLS